MEFLREVLRVCGESIIMEMVWLNKTSADSVTEEANYQLIIKSSSELSGEECLSQIIERYGLKMEKQNYFWVFSRNKPK